MTRISLCLIARDEEQMLPGCLASVRDAVDEMIVVDTGSVDRTMDLARQAGAVVVQQPWQDDFSAPRNRALEEATGDWVLILDADERLAPSAAPRLRAVVEQGGFDCGMLPLHNAVRLDADPARVLSGEERIGEVAYLPRLLRNTADLRYEGIIHESVGEWLLREQRQAKFIKNLDIVHLGGVPDVRQMREKSKRNIALLERYCERCPDDITPFGYLAHEYLESGQPEQARRVADEGWSRLQGAGALMELSVLRLATARAWILVQSAEPAEAMETVKRGLSLVSDHPDLLFIRGCAQEMLGLMDEDASARQSFFLAAADSYEEALSKEGTLFLQKFVQGCTSWAAHVRIGTVHLLRNNAEGALKHFELALQIKESCEEAEWGRVECWIRSGDIVQAIRHVQQVHGKTKPDSDAVAQRAVPASARPDGWVLAALAAEAAGMLENVAGFIQKAQACLGAGFLAPHRREVYYDVLAALSMYTAKPAEIPGPVGQVAAIMRGEPQFVRGAKARELDRGMIRRVVRHLLLKGQSELVVTLVEPEAEQLVPGLASEVSAVVDSMG